MSDPDVTIPSNTSQEMKESEIPEVASTEPETVIATSDSDKVCASNLSEGKIVKSSGLKQPSSAGGSLTRIGRPCNNIPKPAIPRQSSGGVGGVNMASASSLRKASDDFARRRISDLSSTDENVLPFFGAGKWIGDRKSSSGSVLSDSSRKSSSDDLRRKKSSDGSLSLDSSGDYWKFDNEPRRTSDISVVLTQDTDSFIIGDRVWVGGTKPGQIAYIGETQFAPGDWAGVVLDEPIGKNDGSVANIRYFQCEPKRGIFSRLTRLTRYPLLDGNSVEITPTRSLSLESTRNDGPNAKAVPKKLTPVPTPTTPTPKTIFSKPSSPDSSIHPNVSVGDRVIVMSSQGSKAGVLRYLGATDFAPGEWCGVELDDPLGKNDGSVAGTRYFECRPKFGLFAPLHKVSKSPASRRPSQASCQIHRGGGSAGIRRQGSRESLASMSSVASTAASLRSSSRKVGVRTPTTPTSIKNALQESLKEKELHIEQLLKERDLERAEFTRAASQADEAEKRLSTLQRELEQKREESEARIADLDATVRLLRAENEELSGQLEEERKKYEDAQFRFEEVSIETGDLNGLIKNLEDKASLLEKNLADERKRVEVLELESNKLFEAEEQLVIVKDENDVMKEELAQKEKNCNTLLEERTALEAVVSSLRSEMASLKMETEAARSAASLDERNLRESLANAIKLVEETKLEMSKKQSEFDGMRKELENSFAVREKEQSEKNSAIVKDVLERHKLEMSEVSGKLEEMKINAESKMKVLEEKLNERISRCNELETLIQEYSLKLSKATSDRYMEEEKRKELEVKLEKEHAGNREATKKIADDLDKEIEKCKKSEETVDELRKALKEAEGKLKESLECKEREVSALNEGMSAQKIELELARNEAANMMNELSNLKDFVKLADEKHSTRLQELDAIIKNKDTEIERLAEEMERLRKKQNSDFDKQKEIFENNKRELESKIIELERIRAEEDCELKKQLMESDSLVRVKEEELEKEKKSKLSLIEKLKATEDSQKDLELEKQNLLLRSGDSDRKVQSLEERLLLTTKQKEKLESDLAAFISSSNDSSVQLTKLNDELRLREKEMDALRQELSSRISTFERAEQEHKQILSSKESEFNAKEKAFGDKESEMLAEIEKLREELEKVSANSFAVETELKGKMDSYVKRMEGEIKCYVEKISSLEQLGKETSKKHDEDVRALENIRQELKEKLNASENKLTKLEEEKKKDEEDFEMEKVKLRQEMEKLKEEKVKSQQELLERASEEALKHSSEGDKLRKELEETNGRLKAALVEVEEKKKEKAQADEEKLKLQSSLAAAEETCQRNKIEMETRLSEAVNENNVLKNTLTQLREEKWTIDKDATDKEIIITELKTQLKAADEWKKKAEERDRMIEALENKLAEKEVLREKETSEKDKIMKTLTEELAVLKNRLEEMKSSAEAENGIMNELKQELEAKKLEIVKKEEEATKQQKHLAEVTEAIIEEKKKNEGGLKKITELEKEKSELLKRIEEQMGTLERSNQLNVHIQELTKKVKEGDEAKENVRKAMADREILSKTLEEKENMIKNLSNDIETLKRERVNLLNNNKVTVESLEQEKTLLQRKIEEMETGNQGIQHNNINAKGDEGIIEDREFTQGQVDFLNSVIVDMQKKNDALKARIEILEMGFSPEDVEDFTLENLKRTTVAPRLFCDICEVFDLHDTEDCPTQAMDPDAPPPRSCKALPPPQRPYCDICEVFGHDTSECDDAQTF